ncbi:hypothetical protein F5051DRAFT_419141 [Lentinula edodes]|nr:hypothetical protein F5051DRAFT_419141 [Lentinula edodes]
MFRSSTLRLYSTILRHPDKIFSTVFLPPLSWPATDSLSPSPTETSSSLQWKESQLGDKTLTRILSNLQCTLRSVHKRKIYWPVEESRSSNLTPSEYLMMLLRPIPDIFNQLHSPRCLKVPMKCVHVDFRYSICGATFIAEEFKLWGLTAPIVLSVSDDLFQSNGQVSSCAKYALSRALEHTSSATIIVTNFKEIAIFFPPARNRPEPTFERITTTQPSLSLRVLATAYLLDALPAGVFIDVPRPDMEIDEDVVLPQGPPQDPRQPLLGDEEVFATRHRHSDFDMATLVRDRARALQFFRWHEHVSNFYSKLVAHPNDTLTAKTNEVGQFVPDNRPIYPFDASEIPSDTAAHLMATQRKSPLVTAGVAELFKRSKSFSLKIQDVVSKGSERGICTVYRCQITSIDNDPVSISPLCLKLFDDQPLQSPDEDDEELDDDLLPRWFDPVVFAETYALNEAFAYDKLLPAQGSVIPWFYGTHQFTLPDGTILSGLLMEYIEGWNIGSSFTRGLTPDRQIKMIQSCRHAARVLDVADVAQRDWHSDQVILYTNPTTKLDHAVLIDFASTTQTWEPHELNYIQNYFGLLHVLLGRQGDVGLDPELVWKHYGEPDDWDPIQAWIPTEPNGKGMRVVKAKDMFPYISST